MLKSESVSSIKHTLGLHTTLSPMVVHDANSA